MRPVSPLSQYALHHDISTSRRNNAIIPTTPRQQRGKKNVQARRNLEIQPYLLPLYIYIRTLGARAVAKRNCPHPPLSVGERAIVEESRELTADEKRRAREEKRLRTGEEEAISAGNFPGKALKREREREGKIKIRRRDARGKNEFSPPPWHRLCLGNAMIKISLGESEWAISADIAFLAREV